MSFSHFPQTLSLAAGGIKFHLARFILTTGLAQGLDFDFTELAKGLAILSIGGIGVIMAGSFLFPQLAEQYKKQTINVIVGLIMVGIASSLVGYF